MTSKIVDTIRRTGSSTTPVRHIVVIQGSGKDEVETVLSTPIEKIQWGVEYRTGTRPMPMEQYAFRVMGEVVERFADAAALVLKRHHVVLSGALDGHQIYVQQAMAIIAGKQEIRILSEIPEEAEPAYGPVSHPVIKMTVEA